MEDIDLQWFADDCDCYCDNDCSYCDCDCDCSDCDCYCDNDCSYCDCDCDCDCGEDDCDCDCYCDNDCDCSDCVCQVEVRENLAKALNKNQIFVSKGKDGISTPKTYGSVVRSQNIQDKHLSKVLKESMESILYDVKSELLTALQNLQKANSRARQAFNALEG